MPRGIMDVTKLKLGERVKHIYPDGSSHSGKIVQIVSKTIIGITGLIFKVKGRGKQFYITQFDFEKGHAGRVKSLKERKKV